MSGWLKSTAQKLIKYIQHGGPRNPEKAPDRKPTASTGTDSFSVGIHFEALEPRILLSGSGEGTLAGNALQANHEISQNAIEMELLTSHDQNLRLASDFLNTSEADEGTSGSSGDSSSRVVRDAAHDGLSPDNQRSQDIIATSTVLSTDKNQTMDVISGESFDTLTAMDRPQLDTTETGERRELVFVDAGVDNYRELIGDLLENQDGRASIDVFVLDPVRGGVEQINDLLAEHENLDALHVVSHGSDGSVKLGDTWLDNENLDAYADDIAVWQRSLSEGADLLFYGCDLAGGQEGRELLDALGALTGADVAASVDDTGHVVLGGDWDLEYRTGDIETAVAFSTEVQGRWTGLLAETVHESYETGTDSLEIWDGQSWGQTFEDTDGAGNYTVNRISLWMMENSSANKTVIVSLRSSWDGANLASATIASGLLSDGVFVRQDFDFSDVTLSYNTTYYLRIDYASASGKVFVETDASGSYSRGDLLDNGTAQSGDMRFRISEVTITLPTLTTFTGPIDTTAEDTEVEITLADLKAQGDEADSDGTVDGFVVKAITTGTLKIGSSAGAATAWVLGTNDTIDANNHAYWTPAQDANGTLDAFEVVAQDNDGAESVTAGVIARVNVNPVNDAPTLVGTAANPTATESGTGTNQVALIQAGTGGATDVDALNFDGGTITVTLDAYRPGDRLSVLGSPTGVGSISGGDVAALVITLNSGATPANLGAILEALRFENTGDNPTVGGSDTDRVYNIVLNDGGNTPAPAETSNTLTGTITVTGENDAPTATNLNAAETYIEDTALNLTDIVVNDVDSGSVTATLTLSDTAVGILTTGSSGSVTSTFNAGTGEWRASGAIADVNALLASVAFVPTPNYNSNFAIDTSVDDGVAPALTGVKNMTGTPVNDAPTITAVAGPTEADEDTAYDLDLSFTDPDDSAVTWTVNWGDGTITSAASTGVTTTVAHTYARSGFTYNILVSANDGEDTVLQNELLVPTYALGPDSIFRYEETTGGFLQEFAAANGLNNAVQVVVGPDGNIYVTGETSGNVLRYNAVTWAFIDEFISGPNVLGGLAFGPDGHLYVSSHSTDEVLRYDGTSGAFIDDFVTAASGGLDRPYGLTFGPDGNLYVGSYSDNQVLRYDGATGEYIDVFVSSDSGGLSTPEQMIFGPDGHLYIASFDTNEVLRYDGGSGAFIDVFAAAGPPGGLNRPTGLAFGPDGNLYVSDFSDAVILRYDGTTGAFMDEYVTAAGNGGLAGPAWLSFLPEQRVLVRPFADTPTVTNTTTNEDTQSSSGLVISRNAADGAEVTHFKITGIVNGTLYRNDGSTVINDGDFIPFSEGTLGLKFTPSLDFNGLATFNVQASTTGNDTDLSPVATASITVNPVNDAPTLTGANDLSAIDEDPVSNPGTLVSDLISGQTSDPDAASLEGIAVFFVDDASGTWQYSTDGGTNWLAFGSVDASSARLLAADANTYVRFVPDADWNGTVTNGITFHAWDRTSGSNGGNADLTSTYTVRDEFSIPSYSNDNGTASWAGPWVETNDNGLPSSGQVQITGGELSLDNHDFGSFESATRAVNLSGAISATLDFDFRILGGIDSDDSVVIEISSNGGTNWVTLENFTGYTAATSGSRSFDIGAYATSDTRIGFRINNEYRGASEYFRIDNLQIAYTSVGGTGGTSAFSAASASSSISVNPVNDAPTATNLNAAQTYTEDTSLNLTDIVVSDVDSPNVTVTLTLSDAAAGGLSTGTSGSVTSTFAGGMWTASGAIADVNTLLANVTFNPTSDYNSDFDMTASVDDGVAASVTGVKNITGTPVNDPPAITSDGGGDTAAISIDENTSAVTTVTATDADGDTPKFSITGGTDAGLFGIDTNTGVLTFNAAPDFENPGDSNTDNTYVVQVTADDENSGTDVQTLSITVNPVNDNAPVFTSAAAATVDEGQTVVHTLTAADADLPAQAVGFTITGGVDQGRFSIDGSNQLVFNVAPDYENPVDAGTNNVYEVEVTANDGNGGTTAQTINVTVNPVNDNAPVFTSAAAATVDEGQTVVHTLSATDADLPAQAIGFSVTGGADQGRFSIDGSNQLIFNAAPDYENPVDAGTNNDYEVEVTANDGNGGTNTQTITVTVNPVNDNAPVFTSAAAATVDEGQTIVHTLTATDADLPAQAVGFTVTGGADQGRFSIDGSNQLIFNVAPDYENPLDAGTNNVYEVEVTAGDGAGGTTTQTISVTVNPVNDNDPVFTSGATPTVVENTTSVVTLGASDDDLPAQAVSFTITGGVDSGLFQIVGNELQFIAAPDVEAPADNDGDNDYQVTVTASDGAGRTTDQNLTVTVTPVNDNDPVFTSGATPTVAENTTSVVTLSAIDDDLPAQAVSFTITGGVDSGLFQIVGNELQFIAAPDVEAPADNDGDNDYQVTVTASDGAGRTTDQDLTVTVTPVNDNDPVFTSAAAASIDENQTVVHTLTATDADLPAQAVGFTITGGADQGRFSIDGSNQLIFNVAPDYENPVDAGTNNVYEVEVTANDGNGGTTAQTINVTVNPLNDNDPVFTSGATPTVAENTTSVVTLSATDDDLPAQAVSFTITGGVDSGLFQIVGNELQFIAAPDVEAPADNDGDNDYQVTVTASDGAGRTTDQDLTVTVTPVNDNDPVFTSAAAASIDENQTVVHTLTATDADQPAQAVGFTITGGADQGRFSIDGSNQLIFNAAPDYENPVDAGTNNDYEVEVTANDGNGGTNTQTITVTVNPVNDNAPVFTSAAAATVDEGQTIVHTLAATDADLPAQTVGYTITGGADQGRFSIDGSNQLIFNAAPDYENPVDADTDNIYEVEVTASDGSGGTTTQTINVTVNPVNDNAPVMTSASAANIDENQTVVHTLAATDTDLPAQTVGFTITGGADQGRFSINGSNQLVFTAAPDYENPVDADTDNIYEVEVTANDGAGNTTTQTINVTVNPVNDNAPAFTSAAAASIDENQTVVHTLTATDVDLPAQAVGFTITGGADQGWFSINGSNELVFTAAPDYENPVDADTDNVYEVQVTANDGSGGTTVQSIGVTVNNGPEPPTASNLNTSETYTEDIPLNLNDMVISDVDSATVTVTMTLSDLTAGTLSTGTSGTVTSTFSAGVWTASGTISDVNALLASAVFTPTADYNSNFTITVTADDGTTPPLVGVKNMTGTPVNDGVTPPPDDDPIDDPGPEEDPSDTTDPDPEDDPGDGDDEEDTGEEDPLDEGGTEDGTVDSDLSPVRQNGAQKSAVAKTFRAFSNAEGSNLKLAGFANMDLNTVVEFLLSREASSPEPAAIVQAVEQFFNQRGFDPLSALEYEFLMNSLDELKREATSEVQFQDIVASSAIAVTSGLSVGYVIWLIRSGILLSSFLSSMPAWQILDPLPILAGKREDAEDDDEESLETILKKGPQNSEKNDKIKNASSGTMKVMG